jgi:hypothetical protein
VWRLTLQHRTQGSIVVEVAARDYQTAIEQTNTFLRPDGWQVTSAFRKTGKDNKIEAGHQVAQ